MARQLLDVGTQKALKIDNLSDEFKFKLGEDLNNTSMLHIDTIYFTANGAYYYVAHEYKGNNPKWKGKKYARFKYEHTDVKSDGVGPTKRIRTSVPMDETLIVEEKEASYFVEEYARLLKQGFIPNSGNGNMMDSAKKTNFEDYVNSLILKALKK